MYNVFIITNTRSYKGDIIMIVKNKKKLMKTVVTIIGITVGLVLLMTNKTLSHQELKYKTVSVVSGDTLWEIASLEQKTNSYYKNNDIRDIIQDIKTINNLESSSLKTNQALEIPTY